MSATRRPSGDHVELHGTIYEATLVDRVRPIAILRWEPPAPMSEPPVTLEVIRNTDPYHQLSVEYALDCFNQVVYPQAP